MAKLNCPKCPDFDGFAMCTSQPLSKVASYEWCRKYLEGLEEACMETVRQQNSMLDSFPNVMYNKVLGIQKLQYNPGFTSTHTEHVFKTKREDI